MWGGVRGDEGVAALEFALVLPFLLVLLMGMIDYGYYFYVNSTVVNAAREGARNGVVQPTVTLAQQEAQRTARAYLVAAGIGDGVNATYLNNADVPMPTYDASTGNPTSGLLSVTVTVSSFQPLTGFLPSTLLPSGSTHTSQMRWELAP